MADDEQQQEQEQCPHGSMIGCCDQRKLEATSAISTTHPAWEIIQSQAAEIERMRAEFVIALEARDQLMLDRGRAETAAEIERLRASEAQHIADIEALAQRIVTDECLARRRSHEALNAWADARKNAEPSLSRAAARRARKEASDGG